MGCPHSRSTVRALLPSFISASRNTLTATRFEVRSHGGEVTPESRAYRSKTRVGDLDRGRAGSIVWADHWRGDLHPLKRAWGAAWRILAFVLLWAVLLTPSIALVAPERGEGRGLDRGVHLVLELLALTVSGLVALLFLRRWSTADRRGGAGDKEP